MQFLRLIHIALVNMIRSPWTTCTIALIVALVVILLASALAISDGFQHALTNTGSPRIAIALSDRGGVEMNSQINSDQIELLMRADGIARIEETGEPLMSAELVVTVSIPRKMDNSRRSTPLRGMTDLGPELRENFRITNGRMYTPGLYEVIAGATISNEVEGLSVGNFLTLGGVEWHVVGIFELESSIFENEVWADLSSVQSGYKRENQVQSLRIALDSEQSLYDLLIYSASDQRIRASIQNERSYYSRQSEGTINIVSYVGWPLTIVLSIAAAIGTFNVVSISIQSRKFEYKILYILGYSRMGILISVLIEPIVCCLLGAICGSLFVLLVVDGTTTTSYGAGFSNILYDLQVSSTSLLLGFILAFFIGVISGLIPALRVALNKY